MHRSKLRSYSITSSARASSMGGMVSASAFAVFSLDELGCAVFAGSPADFGKFIAAETVKWGKVIRAAGIKPD
jgi:hypothetical protein